MIIQTIVPIHEVLDGMHDEREYVEATWHGRHVVVELSENAREGRIVRLISSDPADFMRAELSPGTIVRLP